VSVISYPVRMSGDLLNAELHLLKLNEFELSFRIQALNPFSLGEFVRANSKK
jgi:hypothetical protein